MMLVPTITYYPKFIRPVSVYHMVAAAHLGADSHPGQDVCSR